MKKIIKNTLTSSSPSNFISLFFNNIWLACLALIITISACDNPDVNNFKTPLTNDTFGTRSVDTLSLILRTELLDSVPSYNFTEDIIGCYRDGITGKTVASSYFSLRLPSATIKLPVTVKVNSVILNIRYAGLTNYFGNITERQTFYIYEVTEKLIYDSIYYSTHNAACDPSPIGIWTGVFNPADTVLSIELDTVFGKKLLSAKTNQLSINDSFQNFFKGIAIVPDEKVFTGAIVYFLLNNTKTNLSIHYNDTGVVVFSVNSNSVRFSNFKHDYSGSIIQSQINNPKIEYSNFPLQPMSGTKVTIRIPYFKHLIDSGLIAIHRAEITFPLDLNSPYNVNAPASLLLLKTDTANKLISIIDRTENYYGGLLNASKTSYSFIITRYLQQLLKEYTLNPSYVEPYTLTLIVPSDNPITAAPVMLKNIDAGGKKVVNLKLWYSKL